MRVQPVIINTTAVKSYFQTHFSPKIHIERNRLAKIARGEFAAKRVRSAYGTAIIWIAIPTIIIMKPHHHVGDFV